VWLAVGIYCASILYFTELCTGIKRLAGLYGQLEGCLAEWFGPRRTRKSICDGRCHQKEEDARDARDAHSVDGIDE
jgi:hypothetical protein